MNKDSGSVWDYQVDNKYTFREFVRKELVIISALLLLSFTFFNTNSLPEEAARPLHVMKIILSTFIDCLT